MTTDQNNPFKHLRVLLPGARNAELPQTLPSGSDTPAATKVRGIPISRLSDSFENFDLKLNPEMKAAYDQCRGIVTGEEWCAILAGNFGNGKTHLGIATINAFGRDQGYFWKIPDFMEWLKERAFGHGEDSGYGLDTLLRGYRTGQFLLVFDDLGAENQTDWASEQLYRVLDARYDLRLPTIITTNQPLSRIDGRIASRLREGLIVCKGKDIRARKP